MARFPDVSYENLSEEQRAVWDKVVKGPRGKFTGPLFIWIESPELADHAQAMGLYCRFGSSLSPRLLELCILVMSAHWKAPMEWDAHVPLALQAGVDPAAVEALRMGAKPQFTQQDEAALYDFAQELLHYRQISCETFEKARGIFGQRGVVDLVGMLGYYSLVMMTLNAFRFPQPQGAPNPFA
jgi:4-carboxymuconolactone decarboxylase